MELYFVGRFDPWLFSLLPENTDWGWLDPKYLDIYISTGVFKALVINSEAVNSELFPLLPQNNFLKKLTS